MNIAICLKLCRDDVLIGRIDIFAVTWLPLLTTCVVRMSLRCLTAPGTRRRLRVRGNGGSRQGLNKATVRLVPRDEESWFMRMDILGLAGAAVIAVGIAAGGWLVGQGVVEARLGNRTVSVKGLSEREVKADLAVWSLRYVASGNDLTEVLRELRGATGTVTGFFTDAGLPAENIEMLSLDVTDQNAQLYRSGPVEVRYIVAQTVAVRTTEVDKVEAASQKVGTLVEAGVVLSNEMGAFGSGPSYVFTKLNDLKPEMIAEATANARDGAAQFATDSGSRVGAIRNASQGLFQILPATDIPNMPESRQITKTVRVVSTIDFFLED